jgi:chorismate dehydratase
MLLSNEIDVGLVPVAIIPQLQQAHIITNYCIGAEQAVASVCIFSQVPLEQIETLILDYQSRTSVNLAKVLLRHYWKKDVVFQDATPDFREHIKGTTAAVVIGDRAFEQRLQSPYVYDLAQAWIDFTGLPFVFAAWVANKPLDEAFITAFNAANALGFDHLDEVVAANAYPLYNLHTYYTQNISYQLTENKRKGLALFLHYLQ